MSLYKELMEMTITEDNISNYKERQSLKEFKFLEKLGNKIKNIIKPKPKKEPVTDAKFNIIKIKSIDQFRKLYLGEALCLEQVDFISSQNGAQQLANELVNDYDGKEPFNFYCFTDKEMNSIFDLHGSNAYGKGCCFIAIDLNCTQYPVALKRDYGFRYFNDIVDNNEYREFAAGRHPYTKQIEWLYNNYEQQGYNQRPRDSKGKTTKKYGLGLSTYDIINYNM